MSAPDEQLPTDLLEVLTSIRTVYGENIANHFGQSDLQRLRDAKFTTEFHFRNLTKEYLDSVRLPAGQASLLWFKVVSKDRSPGSSPQGRVSGGSAHGSNQQDEQEPDPKRKKGSSLVMGDAKVKVASKFPELKTCFSVSEATRCIADIRPSQAKQVQACPVPMSSDVEQHLSRKLLARLLETADLYSVSTEAGVVHQFLNVLRQMALYTNVVAKPGSQLSDDEAVSLAQDSKGAWHFAFEATMRAPGFVRGRIEIQVKRGETFLGACELGLNLRCNSLVDKVEQVKKELICMWCMNALKQVYDPVWVLLSDGESVVRIEYNGFNVPGHQHACVFENGMLGVKLDGEFRCTAGAQLFAMEAGMMTAAPLTMTALEVIWGAFFRDPQQLLSVAEMVQKEQKHAEQIRNAAEAILTLAGSYAAVRAPVPSSNAAGNM
mmetsp:Transcript_33182/g.73351  ORF Transcript_33182/g.73351 Transcript_33182/m.73351 type:complete len:435 (-) Transcript_33182:551-1855(-)